MSKLLTLCFLTTFAALGWATESCPCYDGWINDGGLTSKVWSPSQEQKRELMGLLPKGANVCCWHIQADERITAIYEASAELPKYTVFSASGKGFTEVETGVIATAK